MAAACPHLTPQRLTPMLRQYLDAKRACPPQSLLLFRMGDFFELFFDDAVIAARELGITLTARDKGDNPIPMAGVPHTAITGYIAKLVGRGYSVALCDQVEDPKAARGIVRREITRIITPGTATDLEALDPCAASFLACAQPLEGEIALGLLDLLAGELLCTTVPKHALVDEVARMGVRELLLPQDLHDAYASALRRCKVSVRLLAPEVAAGPEALDFVAARVGTREVINLAGGAETGEQTHRRHAMFAALAACVTFAERTQAGRLTHLRPPRAYDLRRFLVLDDTTRRNLELTVGGVERRRHGTLLWHLDRCATSMGSRLLARWLLFPLQDHAAIARRADGVAFLATQRRVRQDLHGALKGLHDIERLVGRVALGRASPRDVGALAASLRAVPTLREMLLADAASSYRPWSAGWQVLDTVPALRAELDSALAEALPATAHEGGIFARGYRSELDVLITLATESHTLLADFEASERARTRIGSLKVRYNRIYGYFIEVTRANLGQVPADYVRQQTLVNAERFVTAQLKEFEVKVMEADGRRRRLEAEAFEGLCKTIREAMPQLRAIVQAVARLDVLVALADVAETGRYVRPEICAGPVLDLTQARHPVLERLMPDGEAFVANDMQLDADGRQLMLLTGPNMAGKSTVMRQVALCVILAQMGSFVPAQRANIGICDRIFTRVGATDDLGRGQSTFMVEMVETATILRCASRASLVLLDEIGRGTSTFDGVAIAWAVAEHLHDVLGCRGMFATHYHELCALADCHPRIVNASMATMHRGDQLVFLRQLVAGPASRSFGIEVARLANLPTCVVARARHRLAALQATKADEIRQALQTPQTPPAAPKDPPMSIMAADVVAQLARLDIDHLTPVAALTQLVALQKQARMGLGPNAM